jgi:hypothetical protein
MPQADDEASRLAALPTLVDFVNYRGVEQPDDIAYTLLTDRGAQEAQIRFCVLYTSPSPRDRG